MTKKTKPEATLPPEGKIEPKPFTGLIRSVSSVVEKLSPTAPKDRPLAGVIYYVEILLDTGLSYKHWAYNKAYLESLTEFVDQEVSGVISSDGHNIKLDLPQDFVAKNPREAPVKQSPPKTMTQNDYWTAKFIRDEETNKAIEAQYYMSASLEYYLALGKLTGENIETLLDRALAFGMEKYKQYGRTHG